MKVIVPYTITDVMLVSNVSEDEHSFWSATVVFDIGERCIYEHVIYESVLSGNINKQPDLEANSNAWINIGPTNRWAMFDSRNSTITTKESPISVELTVGKPVNAIALLGLSCSAVRVRIQNGTGIVFDETYDMSGAIDDSNWWAYFFGQWTPQSKLIVLDLPSYYFGTVIIDVLDSGLSSPPAEVSCGVCVLGQLRNFSEYSSSVGASFDILDYSVKSTDEFGNVNVVERAYSDRISMSFLINNNRLTSLRNSLAELRSVPCVFIGSETIDTLTVFGFYKTASTVIQYPTCSMLSVEIEGLI